VKKLLLIEDDPFMIEWIVRLLKNEKIEVDCIRSEREFLLRLKALKRADYLGIIVDLMLPWEDGVLQDSDEYTIPRGDYAVAGERIIMDLRGSTGLAGLPVLLYTVNDKPGIVGAEYMRKDEPDEKLIVWVRHALAAGGPAPDITRVRPPRTGGR
jgi:CheY-like chemotaxis protein